jgi:hypothetical protein
MGIHLDPNVLGVVSTIQANMVGAHAKRPDMHQ